MKFLSVKLHGIIDYIAAIGLILGPIILFPVGTSPFVSTFPMIAGAALIMYSLITDYSSSVRRLLPFPLHLAIDFVAGLTFFALAFLLSLTGIAQLFYLIMGGAVMLVVLVSKTSE